MNNFNVNISVLDRCCCKCTSSIKEIQKVVTSTLDFIPIQNCYNLRILSVNNNFALISIDNGTIFFIRRLYIGIPSLICLPNCNCEHSLKIMASSL